MPSLPLSREGEGDGEWEIGEGKVSVGGRVLGEGDG